VTCRRKTGWREANPASEKKKKRSRGRGREGRREEGKADARFFWVQF